MSEKKPYDKIYLIGWHPDASFFEDVTWCQDPIGDDSDCPDIEYVRADLADQKKTQATKDVIAAAEFVARSAHEFNDGGYTTYAVGYEAMRSLIGALKALNAPKEEPK